MKSQAFFSIILLLFTTLSAAWPDMFEAPKPGAIVARQESESQAQSTQASRTEEASESPSPTPTGDSNNNEDNDNGNNEESSSEAESASVTDSASESASESDSASSSGSAKITSASFNKNSSRTAIDPRDPPGGIAMITPAATNGMTFLKVGEQVTFKWNYTSLSVTPAYIDVVATNTVNRETYTIAGNLSTEQTQEVIWDTNEFTKTTDLPFVVATYTLLVYDAAGEPTDVPKAGYLAAFQNLQFGIYTPQPYTPLSEFRCATCSSGALSMHEKQALTVLLGTATITVLSFTWFAGGVFHLF